MPTELTIRALLKETAEPPITPAEMADNRVQAVRKLVDDLSYSEEVGAVRLNVDSKFASRVTRGPVPLEEAEGWFEFDIEIPDELLPLGLGGLQHLVGIVAGDVLPAMTGTVEWPDRRISRFKLSTELRDTAIARYRRTSHTISDIRSKFQLPDNRPLLAFTFKPRVGVSLGDVKTIAVGLAAAGFNIVEFDTRRIDDPKSDIDAWVDIQEAMADKAKQPVAFSPNLSIRADLAIDAAAEWCARTAGHPTTLKVDGGLDGLSTIQAIREKITADPPVVTCYPSLRNSFSPFFGTPDVWVDLLSYSGADIIYPGGRPNFSPGRQVSGDARDKGLMAAQARYRKIVGSGWPMPSYAAGPQGGDLHVALHLLGGDTAMFLGDALRASPSGIIEAGQYIVELIDETAAQITSKTGGKLSKNLTSKYQTHYPDEALIEYSKIFGGARKATPWWKH